MNLILKAAVGIYIVSVLVFSSFSKAEIISTGEDVFAGEELYNLAVNQIPVSSLILNAQEEPAEVRAGLVSSVEGSIVLHENQLFFISSDEANIFKLPVDTLDKFPTIELPLDVSISGFYLPKRGGATALQRVNTLNVQSIDILN